MTLRNTKKANLVQGQRRSLGDSTERGVDTDECLGGDLLGLDRKGGRCFASGDDYFRRNGGRFLVAGQDYSYACGRGWTSEGDGGVCRRTTINRR